MIKLPKKSINFYNKNVNKIFSSGNLAEGDWNIKLQNRINKITNIDSDAWIIELEDKSGKFSSFKEES